MEALRALQGDAAQRFAAFDHASTADTPPHSLPALQAARREARLFVAERDGELAGFCMASEIDGDGHLEALSVARAHGGYGIGSALLEYACHWAAQRGHHAMTLSTFRNVPFNAPFYARRGFVETPASAQGPALTALRAKELARGLRTEVRTCMRREL